MRTMQKIGKVVLEPSRWLCIGIVLAILAIFPFTRDVAYPIKLTLTTFAISVVLGLLVFGEIREAPKAVDEVRWGRLGTLLMLYFLFHVISACLSEYRQLSFNSLYLPALYLLAYFAGLYVLRDKKNLTYFLVCLCCAMAISSGYAFLQKAGFDPFPWADRARQEYRELPATFGNGNLAAHMLGITIVLSCYLASIRRYRWVLLLLPVFFLHLYWTHQRGAWLGLAGAVVLIGVYLFIERLPSKPISQATLTLLAWCGVCGVLGILGIGICKATIGLFFPLDHALMLRYCGFLGGVYMVLAHPIFGWGPGVYRIVNPYFWTEYEQEYFVVQNSMNEHVHNEWIQAGINLGVGGAGLYLLIFGAGIFYALRIASEADSKETRRLGLATAAGLMVFLLDGMTGFNFHVVPVGFVVVILLSLIDIYLPNEKFQWSFGAVSSRFFGGVLFVIGVSLFVGEVKSMIGEMYLQEGYVAFDQKDTLRVERACARGESLLPWRWEFANLRGHAALLERSPRAAITHLERCLKRNPTCIPAMAALGHAYLMLAQQPGFPYEDRKALIEKSVERIEQYAEMILKICPVHHDGSALRATAALLEAELYSSPEQSEQLHRLMETAYSDIKMALRFNRGRTAPNYVLMALIYLKQDELEKAQQSLRLACRLEPENRDAWRVFEEFAYNHNRFRAYEDSVEKAIQSFQNAGERGQKEALAWLVAARARLQEYLHKNPPAAEEQFKRALQISLSEVETLESFADFAKRHNRIESFRLSLCEILEQPSMEESIEGLVLKALVRALDSDPKGPEEAAEVLETALSQRNKLMAYEGSPSPLFAWAAQFVLETLEKEQRESVSYAETLMRLAVVLGESGEPHTALRLVDKALPMLTETNRAKGFYIRQRLLDKIAQLL